MAKPQISGSHTNIGRKKQNEDAHDTFIIPSAHTPSKSADVIIVADGVTSTSGGQQASQLAVDMIRSSLSRKVSQPMGRRLIEAVKLANREIINVAKATPNIGDMSTTVVVAVREGDRLYVAHVGDSRAYLFRDGQARLLTLDHTWVQEAIDQGRIRPDQAKDHPNRHVIRRYMGLNQQAEVDIQIMDPGYGAEHDPPEDRRLSNQITIKSGDIILVCSDGQTERLKPEELSKIVHQNRGNLDKAANIMVEMAFKRGEADNITSALMGVPGGKAAAVTGPAGRPKLPLIALLSILLVGVAWFIFQDGDSNPTEVANPTITPTQAVAMADTAVPSTPVPTDNGEDVVAPAATATPLLAATATPIVLPTNTPTPAPTATEPAPTSATEVVISTATETVTSTATHTRTATPINTVTATARPTITPTVIPSPTPTGTPSPLPVVIPSTPTPRAIVPITPTYTPTDWRVPTQPIALQNRSEDVELRIISPLDNVLTGRQTFRWRLEGIELGENEAYEVIFWGQNGTPAYSLGEAGLTRANLLQIKLDGAIQELDQLTAGRQYRWGVALVQVEPHKRLSYLGGGHLFILEKSQSND